MNIMKISFSLQELSEREKSALLLFMLEATNYAKGDLLDYGCGRQPYRVMYEPFINSYYPFDRVSFNGSTTKEDCGEFPHISKMKFDTIIHNQTLQYTDSPRGNLLLLCKETLKKEGILILTY